MRGNTCFRGLGMRRFIAQCVLAILLVFALFISPLVVTPAHATGAPHRFPQATQESIQLWNTVKDTYTSVPYADLVKHSNPYLRFSEQLLVRQELQAEGNAAPTQEQITERHMQWYAERLNLSKSYTDTQAQLHTLMPALIAASKRQNGTVTADMLRNNAKPILLALTYMRHYYGFSIGGTPVYEHLLADPNLPSALNRLSSLGNRGNLALSGSKTADTYARSIAPNTGFPTITAYLRGLLNDFAPGTDPNQWLKDSTRAIIEEDSPVGLFDKYDRFDVLRDQLLPLVALSGPHIYVGNVEHTLQYGLTSTYGGASDELRAKLAATLREQSAFWEFWKRMSTTMNRVTEPGHVLIIDSMKRSTQTGQTIRERWSSRQGAAADPGVLEFFSPIEKYRPFFQSTAVAEGSDVRFYMGDAIGQAGTNTYTHELTHIYDERIWFNGAGTRRGVGGEVYARGLFEAENNTQKQFGGHTEYGPFFNLNTAYELGENRIQNASPTRFQKPSDVGEYMQGVMDVLYSLDAMEAASALKLPANLKHHAFNKVSLTNNPEQTLTALDTFTSVNESDVAGLKNINDVIDADLVSGRMVPKGVAPTQTVPYNEYVVVPLYEPVYAGMQNNHGVVGSFLFRRHAHELLAEYGWDKGFVGYMSDRYANDAAALADIAAEHGGTMKSFKKAMFERRINRFNEMLPAAEFTNAIEMQAAMDAAVAQDIATLAQNKERMGTAPGANVTRNVTAVRELKDRIFRSYIASTNDFRSSIYQEKREGSVTYTLNATVTLTSEGHPRPFADGDFLFNLLAADEISKTVTGLPSQPVAAKADGTVSLGTFEFTAPGIYTYTINEVDGTNDKIEYDPEEAKVVITVEWASESEDPKAKEEMGAAGKDILRIKSVMWSKQNKPATPPVAFTNTYTPERTQTVKVENISIPIQDEIVLNSELSAWEPDRLLSPGKEGVLTKRTVTTFVDGVQEGSPTVTETITTPMEKRRIERGTKALPLQPAPKPAREGSVTQPLAALVKLMNGSNTRPFKDGEFTLSIKRAPGTSDTIVTGLPDQPINVPANGQVNLGTIVIRDAGTHTLVVEQIRGSNGKITYDVTPVTVTISTEWQPGAPSGNQVPDRLLVTALTYTKGTETPKDITFNNVYIPTEGTEIETRKEKIAITDKVEYDPTIPVTAEPTIREGEEGEITITRTWKTIDGERVGEPTEKRETTKQMRPRVTVKGSKAATLTEATPITAEPAKQLFHMVLSLVADSKHYEYKEGDLAVTIAPAPGTKLDAVKGLPTEAIPVPANGKIDLGNLTFTEAGTYEFTVTQKPGTNPQIQIDPTPVTLRIIVERVLDNEKVVLSIKQVSYLQNNKELTDATVTNTYIPIHATQPSTKAVVTKIEDKITETTKESLAATGTQGLIGFIAAAGTGLAGLVALRAKRRHGVGQMDERR